MARYFIKKKNARRIFEEGEAVPAQGQATAPAPGTTPAPAAQSTPAAQPANNAAQPANNAQAPAPAQGNVQNQPAQPQQPPQPSEKETKVTQCLNQINEAVQKNDPYVLLALNIPDIIKQTFPDFATAADAKDALSKWDAFKKGPSAETFKGFTDAMVTFGKGGQENTQQQQNNQNQPAQQTQQPAQNAATQQAESEYRSFTFSQRLNEKLQDKLKISNAMKSFNDNRFNF